MLSEFGTIHIRGTPKHSQSSYVKRLGHFLWNIFINSKKLTHSLPSTIHIWHIARKSWTTKPNRAGEAVGLDDHQSHKWMVAGCVQGTTCNQFILVTISDETEMFFFRSRSSRLRKEAHLYLCILFPPLVATYSTRTNQSRVWRAPTQLDGCYEWCRNTCNARWS
jgi:hypothetical protein